jgi:MFS family permease
MARSDGLAATRERKIFYGWYIVGVGFLANTASAFALASTLSVFLKPLTADLGVSRGVFSLLRTGEGLLAALLAPLIGTLMDRYGGRWLMAGGAVIAALGYVMIGRASSFAEFALLRWTLVTVGDCFMGYMVINLAVAHWFLHRRGRALALTSMGIGFAKVCMPLLAAWLIVAFGWRETWTIFGASTFILVVAPALLVVRRSPAELGLSADGVRAGVAESSKAETAVTMRPQTGGGEISWTRSEAVRTRAFWLLVITFGISSIGVTGLNLHVFPYVSDLGHSEVIAATVMSVIASMQLASPLMWGFLSERMEPRFAAMLRFVVQGVGLGMAISFDSLFWLYAGFFLYGIGLGGNLVLPDLLWAEFFGGRSLGKVRGLGLLLSQGLAAFGPPFFGFLFDMTGGYGLSFALFGAALITSALLSLFMHRPQKALKREALPAPYEPLAGTGADDRPHS